MELKKGDIIFIKDRSELELKYTGWNNGHIFEFYTLKFRNDEDFEGYFGREKIRLTKSELKEWKKQES